MIPVTPWEKLRSIVGFIFLPTVCLSLFLLLSYQVERIIEDAEPAAAAARLKSHPHHLVAHEDVGIAHGAPDGAQHDAGGLPLD